MSVRLPFSLPAFACVVPSPAKINLNLALIGRRPDGFHDLFSVVAQTKFGDSLHVEWDPDGNVTQDNVAFTGPAADETLSLQNNTLTQAIAALREACGMGREGCFRLSVVKHIPIGSGLGGGSSNAVAFLRAVKQLLLAEGADLATIVNWRDLAASIGSDCPLFLEDEPVVMTGRGEHIVPLESAAAARLRGTAVLLFRPAFGIATAAAYARIAKAGLYCDDATLQQLRAPQAAVFPIAYNDFERCLPEWYPTLHLTLLALRSAGFDARLSGSGSAGFLFGLTESVASRTALAIMEGNLGAHHWHVFTNLK